MTPPADGPGWAERWLRRFTDADTAEAIIGDIVEALGDETARREAVPPLRLVVEVMSATWMLVHDRRKSRKLRTEGGSDMDSWSPTLRRVAALIGLTACLPALVLVTGGVLQMFFGTPQVMRVLDQTIHNQDLATVRFLRHPATVLGGILIAVALNLLPLLRVGVSRHAGTMVGTLTVRTRAGHLAVAALAGVLLTVLLGYGFTENFRIEPRSPAAAALPEVALSPCPVDGLVEGGWTTSEVRLLSRDGGSEWSTAWPRVVTFLPACADPSP